jgi:ribosome biogenesis protein BRX1
MVNELAELSSCNNALFFEARRHQDLYMWASKTPNGPSVRFHVLNSHTMDELKMTGNNLKGSRPIVCFDETFDSQPHLRLIKELLMHVSFSLPFPLKPFSELS